MITPSPTANAQDELNKYRPNICKCGERFATGAELTWHEEHRCKRHQSANTQNVVAIGRFEILHDETTDSIVIVDIVSHDDIAEVFHNERHTVSQSCYQARETAQLFAAAPELLAALLTLIPRNVALGNPNWADGTIIPVDMTLGELRQARAAIEKATAA